MRARQAGPSSAAGQEGKGSFESLHKFCLEIASHFTVFLQQPLKQVVKWRVYTASPERERERERESNINSSSSSSSSSNSEYAVYTRSA